MTPRVTPSPRPRVSSFASSLPLEVPPIARWPDNSRSTLITAALIFGLFPVLAWLAWWFVRR